MIDAEFKNKYKEYKKDVEDFINSTLIVSTLPQKNIYESQTYSLSNGGKRLRPVLALAVCEALKGKKEYVLPFAVAIEKIHTYSLVHDDLPAMDNDDYRRGRLSTHKVYGEAMAILTGDALLNSAFETMSECCVKYLQDCPHMLQAMLYIARAAGSEGMIGGQVIDIESEGMGVIPYELLKKMHSCKTGALIKASVISSAMICNPNKNVMCALDDYSDALGLAFQIKDDLLDVEGEFDKLGKTIGKDSENNKPTYVSLFGIEKARELLIQATSIAINSVKIPEINSEFLIYLAKYLQERNK